MMESLTAQMAAQVRQRMAQIDAQGGVFQSIESGWISQTIHLQAMETQARLDCGMQRQIISSAYENTEKQPALPENSQALLARQCRRLIRLRLMRDKRSRSNPAGFDHEMRTLGPRQPAGEDRSRD